MKKETARVAVVGAGLIGQRHCRAVQIADGVTLSAVVDPSDDGRAFADSIGATWFADMSDMIAAGAADGVLLATPNTLHAAGANICIDAGLPVLIEKPIFTDIAEGWDILQRADAKGVAVAAGHHRRHNPLIARAKQSINDGDIGQIVSVQCSTWFMKPDYYYDVDWRKRKGAGPIYLNLIHDIDLLQFLCGPITEVRAIESNAVRNNEVEDTAVVLVRFDNGALGTVNVSDTIVAPISWELTARENPAYPATNEACYWIGGTKGSLSLPQLGLWTDNGARSWWEPISQVKLIHGFDDPLVLQAAQFGDVIRGTAKPVVTGWDGLAALSVINAVKEAAQTGQVIDPRL